MSGLRRKLPPPNSIIAFEAAARCQNFTQAGRELNVSQAAVSRHIRNLETFLGLQVFRRANGRAQLTPEGRALFLAVDAGFEQIASAVAQLRRSAGKNHLTVAATTSFASLWLIPRLAAFRREFPDLDLRIISTDADFDAASDQIDVGIKYGHGRWPGLEALPLLEPEIFPVCSPALLASGPRLHGLPDLDRHTLLDREEAGTFAISWAAWLAALGAEAGQMRRRILFNNHDLLIRAAIGGQGIALGWTPLVNELLRQRLLVRPLASCMRPQAAYYLVMPKRAPLNRTRDIFLDWIRRAVAEGPQGT